MSKNKIKVLIELDEELFKNVVERTKHGYIGSDVWIAVANGTPYTPSGDLISREALKKAINDNGCRHSHYFDIFDVIDNAPTVDLWQLRQEATENALKKADEWISVKDKLPEPLISVIATDNSDVFVAWYNEGWKSSDSQFDKHTPIVAWRPIPQYTECEKGGAE